jgi:hypothetical protein
VLWAAVRFQSAPGRALGGPVSAIHFRSRGSPASPWLDL